MYGCLCTLEDLVVLSIHGLILDGSTGKDPPAGDTGDIGSISESGRSPGKENINRSSILSWKIPWTEEPGGLQSKRVAESDPSAQLITHICRGSEHTARLPRFLQLNLSQ